MTAAAPVPAAPAPPPPPVAAAASRWFGVWVALVIVGLAVRVAVVAGSYGTNDAYTWNQFGHYVNQWGLYVEYNQNKYLNHPPLPVYWAVVAYRTAVPSLHWWDDKPFESPYFGAVFRVPAVLADVAACYVLYRFWRGRVGPTKAAAVAAAFAWSPCAILVSGYHTNTDSVLALMILLAAVAASAGLAAPAGPATGRRRPFLAGLALAGAINVKLTPILLIPVLLLSLRRARDVAAAVGGLAVGALPFVPLLALCWAKFYAQALGYRSNPESWGILYLLMRATNSVPDDAGDVTVGPSPVVGWYYEYGRFVVLAAVVAWSAAGQWLSAVRRTAGPADLYAVAVALFLIFAPGFGIQYTVTVLPVMFASRPRWAAAYGLVAGAYALLVYQHHWTGTWPAYSMFRGRAPLPIPYVGLAAWAVLIGYVVAVVVSGRRDARRS